MKNWKIRSGKATNDEEDPKIISIERSSPFDNHLQGNKIYFYTDVDPDSVLNLNKQIDDLTKQMKMIQFTYNLPTPPNIELHICSDGGDVFSSVAAIDKIKNNVVPIHTYCEGMVASAATLISSVGHKRCITKNSCMLIHQVSSELWGNYTQFKDEVKNLELVMELIRSVYINHTKFNDKELEDLLNHDLYLDAKKCFQYGLVDEVI